MTSNKIGGCGGFLSSLNQARRIFSSDRPSFIERMQKICTENLQKYGVLLQMTGLAFNRLKETRSISILLRSIRVLEPIKQFFFSLCLCTRSAKILTKSENVMHNETIYKY